MTAREFTVKCPHCRTEIPWHGNPFRPFCSERCRLIDLGTWMDEGYRIPSDEMPGEEDDDQGER